MMPRKRRVKEIGKPTKMPASIAPIIMRPIISGLMFSLPLGGGPGRGSYRPPSLPRRVQALDELGDALDDEERHADGQRALHRPEQRHERSVGPALAARERVQIGRASCRERV